MSIWNKVLVGVICVVALGFLYMAARTLKTHQYWRELAQRHQQRLDAVEQENIVLVEGQGEGENTLSGITQIELDLKGAIVDRGRVWYHCTAEKVDPQTGQAAVTTDSPNPHGIGVQTVLCVFAEADGEQPGSFLGEFKVTAVDQTQVALEPAMKLNARELQRLAAAKAPWSLYEMMPADRHGAFSGVGDEELKSRLPESAAEQYVHDGKPAAEADLEAWGVAGEIEDEKYVRPLRDYEVLFEDAHLKRSILIDLAEAARRDVEAIRAAQQDADSQHQFREQEKIQLAADQAKINRQRDAAAAHLKAVELRLVELQQAIAKLLEDNKRLARIIAKSQLEATQQIDAQTRRMAQSRAGAN